MPPLQTSLCACVWSAACCQVSHPQGNDVRAEAAALAWLLCQALRRAACFAEPSVEGACHRHLRYRHLLRNPSSCQLKVISKCQQHAPHLDKTFITSVPLQLAFLTTTACHITCWASSLCQPVAVGHEGNAAVQPLAQRHQQAVGWGPVAEHPAPLHADRAACRPAAGLQPAHQHQHLPGGEPQKLRTTGSLPAQAGLNACSPSARSCQHRVPTLHCRCLWLASVGQARPYCGDLSAMLWHCPTTLLGWLQSVRPGLTVGTPAPGSSRPCRRAASSSADSVAGCCVASRKVSCRGAHPSARAARPESRPRTCCWGLCTRCAWLVLPALGSCAGVHLLCVP